MKRIATIQDISCIGKCSLTVALPIISAMDIECAVIPTAVLSNHTAFSDFTFRDLTQDIPGIIDRWKAEALSLDAVYSGYLGSVEQINFVRRLFEEFSPAIRFVDPAMADHGVLYKGFDDAFVREMAALCAQADVIVPNLTEACLMTGLPYREIGTGDAAADEAFVKEVAAKLGDMGAGRVILTGVTYDAHSLGALCYDTASGSFSLYQNERVPQMFHGTGDVFASAALGALVHGCSVEETLRIAVDFTLLCLQKTLADPAHNWYGVNFESALPYLTSLSFEGAA